MTIFVALKDGTKKTFNGVTSYRIQEGQLLMTFPSNTVSYTLSEVLYHEVSGNNSNISKENSDSTFSTPKRQILHD